MKLVVYSIETGDVVRCVECRDDEVLLQFDAENEGYLPVDAFMLCESYVSNGEVIEKPDQPSLHHLWTKSGWVEPDGYLGILENEVRAERKRRLSATDWTQLPDVPLATKKQWAMYRQALRDLPEQFGFPTEVVWPETPQ